MANSVTTKSTSNFVTVNRSNWDNINHVSLYGTIDKRFAWMRVANGAINGTNNQVGLWQLTYALSMVAFRQCQLTRRWLIPLWTMQHSCGRAYNALATFDNQWQHYTALGGASDGWIANSSGAYPGTALTGIGTLNETVGFPEGGETVRTSANVNPPWPFKSTLVTATSSWAVASTVTV